MRAWRWAAEIGAWAAAALGVWLLTLSSVTYADLSVAIPAALASGAGARASRRALSLRAANGGRLHWLTVLPAAIVRDTAAVLALPWRRLLRDVPEGHWERIPVRPGADTEASAARIVATALVSATPGSFVVHDDPDTGELLVHVLVSGRPSVTAVVRG
ncbi:MAG TPA: hypothetical protein VHB69_09260 [Mycobacteriales bacterium]|nr:hypothetical protein [Mycobacteriales bacterium]